MLHHPSRKGPVHGQEARLIEALAEGDGGKTGQMVPIPEKKGHCMRLVHVENELDETIETHGSKRRVDMETDAGIMPNLFIRRQKLHSSP